MKDRIAHIMRAKNLKATDFAALLGIQPSGVSHILAGRNNPSLEFVKKIKETFPEYNLDWIIFGKGPMTTSEPYKNTFNETPSLEGDLPPRNQEPATLFDSFPEEDPVLPVVSSPEDTSVSGSTSIEAMEPSPIKSMAVFYLDGTFELYKPR